LQNKGSEKDILKLQIESFYLQHLDCLVSVTKTKAGLEMNFIEKFPTEKKSSVLIDL